MTLTRIAIESSTSAARSWKMIAVLFAVNFFPALLFAFGFRANLQAGFGDSLLPERLMQGFNATAYGDLLRLSPQLLTPFWGQLFWLILLSFVLNTIFAGGIIRGLHRGADRFSLAEFFTDCGTYLVRLLVLLAVAGIGLFLIGIVWFLVAGIIFSALSSGASTEPSYVSSFIIAVAIYVLPMVIMFMVVDYSKVALVLDEERSPFQALWKSTKFVFKHLLSTTAWQWMMILIAAALVVFYWLIERNMGMATGFGVFLVFLLQQISVGGRIWVKLATIGGQIRLFESRQQEMPAVSAGFVPPVAEPLPPVPSMPVKKATRRPKPSGMTRRSTRRKR